MLSQLQTCRSLVKGRRKKILQFLLLSFLLTVVQAPIPYLTGYMIDTVLPHNNPELLIRMVWVLAGLYAGNVLLSYLNSRLRLTVRKEIMVDLCRQAINGMLKMSHNERLEHSNGDLVSRLTRDTLQLDQVMPYGWSNLFHQGLLAVSLLVVVFILDWKLSLMLIGMLPLSVWIYSRFNDVLWQSSRDESLASGARLSAIQETIEADAEVKSYEAEDYFLAHSQKSVEDFEEKSLIREGYDLKISTIIVGMPMLAIVLIWYFGGHRVISGELSLGLIITYTATLAMIVPALVSVIEFISSFPNEMTALERVSSLFSSSSGNPSYQFENQSTAVFDQAVEKLSIKNISFSYSPRYPLFSDLSLCFNKGCGYLVNGGNGAGKSTLLTLLSGSLKPERGDILLDEINIESLEHRSSWITYVPQRIHIVSDSVLNNVTLGKTVDRIHVREVMDRVGMGSWIDRLEDGLDHVISNAASELSGGQIQKIGIARALLRNTPILLMDEPTNNLDSEAVKLLITTIKKYKQDRIVIIISHDDRIFDAVDQVIYLENSNTNQSTRVVEK